MRSTACRRKKQHILMKIVRLPIRLLSQARDVYIKSMVECAGRTGYGGRVICHTLPEPSRLPKSFSVGSSTANDGEEYRQLLCTVSKHGIDQKTQQQQQPGVHQRTMESSASRVMGTRSYSVGIGKIGMIDEDRPCSFEEDVIDAMADLMCPKSRCHADKRNLIVYHY
ncbi:Detected protein of unknown function [Hibiscus syriacus]|uniref:Uncharacterized protein n=1 Tax=Hibiscus syriacus TaxID=106335 RepID=A0A6A2X071_HIBSY|nr:uncharacterized protein LOC120187663 [Hibiscus syriacus]KAE8661560.1 Detected protein of unknown function [Hibiscus syriacus]